MSIPKTGKRANTREKKENPATMTAESISGKTKNASSRQNQAVLYELTRLLISKNDQVEFINSASGILTEKLGYTTALIALTDKQGTNITASVESLSGKEPELRADVISHCRIPACMESVLEQDSLVIIRNPGDECPGSMPGRNSGRDTRMSRRLADETGILGVLCVAIPGSMDPETKEQEIFNQIADEIAFALHKFREKKDLRERIKELDCHNSISHLLDNESLTIPEILQGAAEIMAAAWQYPEITRTRIEYDGLEYSAGNSGQYAKPISEQKCSLQVHGKIVGSASAAYTEVRPELDEGPFLQEERALLESIAKKLSASIELRFSRESLNLHRHITATLPHPISYIDSNYRYLAVNEVFAEFFNTDSQYIIGHEVAELFDHDVYNSLVKPNIDLCLAGKELNYVVEIECYGKGKRWMEMHYRPHRRENGEIVGVVTHGTDITEYKQAETRVKKFKTISDHAIHGKIIMDLDGTITYANDYIARIHGYKPDELVGENISLLHNREQLVKVEKFLDSLQEVNQIGPAELWHFHKNGTVFPMLASFSLFRDEQSQPQFVACSSIDISEQKQTEEALLQSELRLRNVFNQTYQFTGIVDLDGTLAAANQTSLDFIQASEAEVIGRMFWDTPWWKHSSELQEWLRAAVSRACKGETIQKEVTHTAPDGAVHYFEFSLKPFTTDNGRILYLIPESRDITAQKMALEALQKSEQRFRTIFENAPIFIDAFDKDGRCILWNKQSQKTFGWTIEELNAREDIFSLFYPDPEEHEAVLESTTTGTDGKFKEWHPVTRDGKKLVTMWANFRLPEGIVISLGYDLTERRKADRDKARMEEQFHKIQKLESIGRLAGGIAHDLNNLLTPILGYSELLLEKGCGKSIERKPVEKIAEAGGKARDLVRQLLAFSRKQTLEFRRLDLNSLLIRFEELLRRTIREDIEIKLLTAGSLPLIQGDPGELERIIMNLAVNAQDAMPQGGKLVIQTSLAELDREYASSHQSVTPGKYILLSVSDTGSGMNRETIDHIFEPFFTTKSREKGTGLGLSTAYGIVKQHKGNIWAYSEPGLGTTIKVYLPVLNDHFNKEPDEETPAKIAQGSGTILLVEDDYEVRNLASTILEKKGYRVISAESGKMALETIRKHQDSPDLLLTDVVMPEMNGRQLHEEIIKEYPDIKTIFMSGYTQDVIAHHGIMDPGFHFIQKPFSINSLAKNIQKVLGTEK